MLQLPAPAQQTAAQTHRRWPMDVDHIIPSSKANKYQESQKDGRWIDVNAIENLAKPFALHAIVGSGTRIQLTSSFRKISSRRKKSPSLVRSEGRVPED